MQGNQSHYWDCWDRKRKGGFKDEDKVRKGQSCSDIMVMNMGSIGTVKWQDKAIMSE